MVCTPELSLRGGRRPTWRPEREARGSALGVQSRSTQPDNRVLPANTAALRDGASRTPPPTRRVRSAGIPGNLQLPKALTERRYRRNRLVRFYRHLVRTGSAFPRLPRPLWGLAMTRQGSAAMGTVRRTELALLLPLRGRAWLSPPLQGQCGLNDGRRMIHSSFFSIHYSLFHPSPCGGWQTI